MENNKAIDEEDNLKFSCYKKNRRSTLNQKKEAICDEESQIAFFCSFLQFYFKQRYTEPGLRKEVSMER